MPSRSGTNKVANIEKLFGKAKTRMTKWPKAADGGTSSQTVNRLSKRGTNTRSRTRSRRFELSKRRVPSAVSSKSRYCYSPFAGHSLARVTRPPLELDRLKVPLRTCSLSFFNSKTMATVFALGARTVGDVRVPKSQSAMRTSFARSARPAVVSRGRVASVSMPGMAASRGVSLKVSSSADKRIEMTSSDALAPSLEAHAAPKESAASPQTSRFAVPALAFAAAVLAFAPAGPASAAAAAVATINQADTAWVLISTGTCTIPERRNTRDASFRRYPTADHPFSRETEKLRFCDLVFCFFGLALSHNSTNQRD